MVCLPEMGPIVVDERPNSLAGCSLPSLTEQSFCQTTDLRKPTTLALAAGSTFAPYTSPSAIQDELRGKPQSCALNAFRRVYGMFRQRYCRQFGARVTKCRTANSNLEIVRNCLRSLNKFHDTKHCLADKL